MFCVSRMSFLGKGGPNLKSVGEFPKRVEQKIIVLPRWRYAKTKIIAPAPPGVAEAAAMRKHHFGEDNLDRPEEEVSKGINNLFNMGKDGWRDNWFRTKLRPHEDGFDRDFSKLKMPKPDELTPFRERLKPRMDASKGNLYDPTKVVVTQGQPTLTFDLGSEAAAEDHAAVKSEMEDLRRRVTAAHWKRFLSLMDQRVSKDVAGFDEWAQEKNLEQIYGELMADDRRVKRKAMYKKFRLGLITFIGMYGYTSTYGWHFFELY